LDNREYRGIYRMSLTDTEITVKLPIDGAEGLLAILITNKNLFTVNVCVCACVHACVRVCGI